MSAPQPHIIKVETDRFGPFTFELGIDLPAIDTLLLRINDAYARFQGSPLAQVSNQLEKEVVVSSIFGTNTIEGGTLTQEDTALTLELAPAQIQGIEQRRAINLKHAYDLALTAATQPGWRLSIDYIRRVHAAVTDQLPHEHNRPTLLRDNPKGLVTHVGNAEHGGRYKPPQYGKDIEKLLEGLIAWHQQLQDAGVHALLRAPLVHLYYELIHPFWDGNGRVGRILEATLLQAAGYQFAPFAQARYYLANIHQYFALFNHCRKLAGKKAPHPNTAFVAFFLNGMLTSINALHDRVNAIINVVLFENHLNSLLAGKQINARQHAITQHVLRSGKPVNLAGLKKASWYLAMYKKLGAKTQQRDLAKLYQLELIRQDVNGVLWPGCITPV